MTARVALYLQDAHPIRDGMRYSQHAEAAGFETVMRSGASCSSSTRSAALRSTPG